MRATSDFSREALEGAVAPDNEGGPGTRASASGLVLVSVGALTGAESARVLSAGAYAGGVTCGTSFTVYASFSSRCIRKAAPTTTRHAASAPQRNTGKVNHGA